MAESMVDLRSADPSATGVVIAGVAPIVPFVLPRLGKAVSKKLRGVEDLPVAKPPVAAPEPPVSAPKPPVSTPEPPIAAPELPVAAPEPPVSAPKPPVSAPEPPIAPPVGAPAVLPKGVPSGPLHNRAMALINQLPPHQRRMLMEALEKLPPKEASALLTKMGRLKDVESLSEGLQARIDRAAGAAREPGGLTAEGPSVLDPTEESVRVINRPTVRVDPETVAVSRGAFTARMQAAGMAPDWARTPADWNPHHLIPVEFQNHEVFDVLRQHGGWDHHAPKLGIPLPTRPGIPGAEGLPVHQVTREVIEAARAKTGSVAPMPSPATMRELRGHGVLNERVGQRLDALAAERLKDGSLLVDHPDQLRTRVQALVDDLRRETTQSGRTVQF